MMGVELIDGKPAGHSSSQARPLFGHSQQGALRQGAKIRQVNVLGHETTTYVTKSNRSFKLRHEDKGGTKCDALNTRRSRRRPVGK
jgi:hypothetical protein